jgi:hypothetical protein
MKSVHFFIIYMAKFACPIHIQEYKEYTIKIVKGPGLARGGLAALTLSHFARIALAR